MWFMKSVMSRILNLFQAYEVALKIILAKDLRKVIAYLINYHSMKFVLYCYDYDYSFYFF